MKPQNILVTTYGTSWQIIPELIGFLNHQSYNFYELHPQWKAIHKQLGDFDIPAVDQVFVLHTDHHQTHKSIQVYQKWLSHTTADLPQIRFFCYQGVDDINDFEQCRFMTDMIFRAVLKAREECKGGKLILSLTGGRKSMSADMQWASEIFGCHAMVHVGDAPPLDNSLTWENETGILHEPLSAQVIKGLYPMVVFGNKPEHSLLAVNTDINTANYPLIEGKSSASNALVNDIINNLQQSRNLLFNYYRSNHQQSNQTSFSGLQMLGPKIIQQMENEFVGADFENFENDMNWLRVLPKAELHCHLGGILDVKAMISVAKAVKTEVDFWRKKVPEFELFGKMINEFVEKKDYRNLTSYVSKPKTLLRNFQNVPDPIPTAAFLLAFQNDVSMLESLIFGDFISDEKYCRIGFDPYAALGDLQGTGLLSHPATLQRACEELIKYCRQDNIRYMEIRCSPANYANGNFSMENVFEVLHNTLANCPDVYFRIIIIASRHKDDILIEEHVDYVVRHMDNEEFIQFFAGFDVAGNEMAKSPKDLKKHLKKLLNQSIHMTIHAGENVPVNNVWEAVYELNADRIGHGLTLKDDPKLLNRFVNRRITVEMCPSSNYQIIGFRDFRYDSTSDYALYPFYEYFKKGVRVTLNTDNPGISRTHLSDEYYKAACMTQGGISKWDILKVLRNSFISAFIPFKEKKDLLLDVEKKLVDIL